MVDASRPRAPGAPSPIGVCGESAGDPLLALVLVGLGVSSLSMAPSKVPIVRLALSTHSRADCERLAATARRSRTARDAYEAVRAAASSALTDIL